MVFHIRRMLKYNERNPNLKGGSAELYSKRSLLGVHQKSHNVAYWFKMRPFERKV